MVIYYLIFILGLLCTVFDYSTDRATKTLVFCFYCTLLILFAGLRSVGTDNDSVVYEEAFKLSGNLFWVDIVTGNYDVSLERGYMLINKAWYSLGGNIHSVFLSMAVLTGVLNYRIIFNRTSLPFTYLLFYVSFFYLYRDFTQIRFALACALTTAAAFSYIDKRFVWSMLLFLGALTFHSSALIFVVLILVSVFPKRAWIYWILPILGFIGAYLNPIDVLYRLGVLPAVLVNYVENLEHGRGGYFLSIIAQAILTGGVFFFKRLTAVHGVREINFFLAAISLSSFLNLLFISFSIMQRFSFMLFGIGMFLMPQMVKLLMKDEKDRNIVFLLQGLFNLIIFYYGVKMISPEILKPYEML